jgi:hypothetical protein
MAAILTPEFWRVPVELPVLIPLLLAAFAAGMGLLALIYKGQREASKERLELARERLTDAHEKLADLKTQIEVGAPREQLAAKAAAVEGVLDAVDLGDQVTAYGMSRGRPGGASCKVRASPAAPHKPQSPSRAYPCSKAFPSRPAAIAGVIRSF